jgi:two-component system, LytTR family, response regulator LytT
MKIRCLAVDDEPFALKQMADYIRKTPFLELSGECYNAFQAMEIISSSKIDLIFLDINMPEMSGMEFAKTLPAGTPVIFTTAYSQYAVESYRVDAIDYLLKPISYDDFLRAANKALKVISQLQEKITGKALPDDVFVNSEGKIIRISLQEIDFIESLSEYVKIYLENKKPVMTLMRMKNLENLLPSWFMRVHRSYIVNLRKVTTIERNRIVFYGNTYIPVSEQYKEDFKKFVESNFL